MDRKPILVIRINTEELSKVEAQKEIDRMRDEVTKTVGEDYYVLVTDEYAQVGFPK